jgi:hypothetical protein
MQRYWTCLQDYLYVATLRKFQRKIFSNKKVTSKNILQDFTVFQYRGDKFIWIFVLVMHHAKVLSLFSRPFDPVKAVIILKKKNHEGESCRKYILIDLLVFQKCQRQHSWIPLFPKNYAMILALL